MAAADPRVGINGTELTWPTQFVFSHPDGATRSEQHKVTKFRMSETGVVLYQGPEVESNWWIDDLAIGPERLGCQ